MTDYSVHALERLQGVSFAYLNICSILCKCDEVRLLLEHSNLDFLALGETFLNESITDAELHIYGYHIFRSNRTIASGKSDGGGLLIYASDKYSSDRIHTSCSPNLETIWLNIQLTKSTPICLCAFCRPPDANVSISLAELESHFSELNITQRFDIVMMGDCNIDVS